MKVWVVDYNNRQTAAFADTYTAQQLLDMEVELGYVDPTDEGIEMDDDSLFIDDWLRADLVEVIE